VKHWEIDNEIWRLKPDDYAGILKGFVPAMKKIDPTIVVAACGSGQLGGRWKEGDVAVISQCAELVDYLSIHHYENPNNFASGIAKAEAFWASLSQLISTSKNARLRLYISEWNAQTTDWRTGLYAGGILNAFERSEAVGMAGPALFLRHVSATAWDNAFINFDHRTWFPAPNYVVMKLYRDHYAADRVAITGDWGAVNAVATKSADGKHLYLKAVNPTEQAVNVRLEIAGDFPLAASALRLVAPDSLSARNTLESPEAVRVTEGKIERDGKAVRFSLPRWSVGVVALNR
jgi:alpha-N-arabinofuranosidase